MLRLMVWKHGAEHQPLLPERNVHIKLTAFPISESSLCDQPSPLCSPQPRLPRGTTAFQGRGRLPGRERLQKLAVYFKSMR